MRHAIIPLEPTLNTTPSPRAEELQVVLTYGLPLEWELVSRGKFPATFRHE